jgi:hypothetical protein
VIFPRLAYMIAPVSLMRSANLMML